MKANTTYHMRAIMAQDDGSTKTDSDQVFTTGPLPPGILPKFTVTPTPGMTPQPGVELVDVVIGTASIPFATDTAGNVVWTYSFPDRQKGSILYPVKLLPNGHFIFLIGPVEPPATMDYIREIDLAGNTIKQLAMTDLNASLQTAGYNITLNDFSHDFEVLPNGHILVIRQTTRVFTDLPGYPGALSVFGDVVVDLDATFKPVWLWNSFDHLDINRHPYGFPDFTHSNALVYSPDDSNFVISMRHQNWIMKIDYRDGAGSGNILWKLGYQGDFKLEGAVDPTNWFYAQHDASFVSSNTTGVFKMAFMDNGDDRVFAPGVTCGTSGAPACLYTTVGIMQVDENAKTASYLFHQQLPPALYSYFAGSTRVLPNNNVEYNLAGADGGAYTFEVTPTTTPQTVWEMHLDAANTYRFFVYPACTPASSGRPGAKTKPIVSPSS